MVNKSRFWHECLWWITGMLYLPFCLWWRCWTQTTSLQPPFSSHMHWQMAANQCYMPSLQIQHFGDWKPPSRSLNSLLVALIRRAQSFSQQQLTLLQAALDWHHPFFLWSAVFISHLTILGTVCFHEYTYIKNMSHLILAHNMTIYTQYPILGIRFLA